MKPKTILKMSVNILMTVALLALMSYELVGAETHEQIGVCMLVLVMAHIYLNRNWLRNISKGKYTPYRVFQTILTVLMFSCIIGLMVSGIMMSKYVFNFLGITGGQSFARVCHMFCAYWGFVLMSLHLGLHAGMIMNRIGNVLKNKNLPYTIKGVGPVVAVFIAVYGIYAFVIRDVFSYMFLRKQFVFFNFQEPLILFFLDYFSIMFLFIFIGFYIQKKLKKI